MLISQSVFSNSLTWYGGLMVVCGMDVVRSAGGLITSHDAIPAKPIKRPKHEQMIMVA